jgi:hypothetical protein
MPRPTPTPDRPSEAKGTWARLRRRFANSVSWTAPTSTEIGVVAKAGLAAGLSWWAAQSVTGVSDPVLAPLAALVTVRVSVRSSIQRAILRSVAVVMGVFLALALGDTIGLSAVTVGLLVAASLGVAELVLRLPTWAATQVPISMLVVLAAVGATSETNGWRRAIDTVIGAAVGVVVSLALPASRFVDARQTLDRLGRGMGGALEAMGQGLNEPWSTDQSGDWRRQAHTVRERLVSQAVETIGNGREAARWNHRDRGHIDELGRYEELLPRLERVAIGTSAIARSLDEFARLSGGTHGPMPKVGSLLVALASAVRATVHHALAGSSDAAVVAALAEVRTNREACSPGAARRARLALDHDEDADHDQTAGEWLGFAAVLVHVDRIVSDLSPPAGAPPSLIA